MPACDRPLHGEPSPPDRLHPRLYLAEAAGTALLVLFGLSAVLAVFANDSPVAIVLPSPASRRVLAGACFGTVGALIAISPLGRISGAHINPAVSIAFYLERKLAWRDTIGYVMAQMLGAVIGAWPLLLWGPIGAAQGFGATVVGPGIPVWRAFVGETFAGAALVAVVFVSAAHEWSHRYTPWLIPLLMAWLVWWEAPWSGASANPARSLGPAVVSGQWANFWIYMLAPTLGAVIAVRLMRWSMTSSHRVKSAHVAKHD